MFDKILDRFFVVLGALIFMQLPFFIEQYQHQLKGHVAELKWQVNFIHNNAQLAGKSDEEFIKKFARSEDPDLTSQGKMMQETQKRFEKRNRALLKLQSSTPWAKPFLFIFFLQKDIFFSTFESFYPGVSFSYESFFYILVGMSFGYFLYRLLRLPFAMKS